MTPDPDTLQLAFARAPDGQAVVVIVSAKGQFVLTASQAREFAEHIVKAADAADALPKPEDVPRIVLGDVPLQ